MHACACVRACVRACARMCVCVCVCVCERARARVPLALFRNTGAVSVQEITETQRLEEQDLTQFSPKLSDSSSLFRLFVRLVSLNPCCLRSSKFPATVRTERIMGDAEDRAYNGRC